MREVPGSNPIGDIAFAEVKHAIMNDIFYVDRMKISYVPELPLYNVDM